MERTESNLYRLTVTIFVGVVVFGVVLQGVAETWRGLIAIQLHPARLLNDFTVVGGEGAALVNAVIVAAVGLVATRVSGIRLSGPTVAAVFTMFGFGLFGKTPLNVLPIFLGVALSARIAGKRFRDYILMALFGTALGPLVTGLAVEAGVIGSVGFGGVEIGAPMGGGVLAAADVLLAALGGVAAGVLLPPVAMTMLRMHQGFNLYNIGLTSGFIAVFAAAFLRAAGSDLGGSLVWNTEPSMGLIVLVPVVSMVLCVAGLARGRRGAVRDVVKISRMSGRLPSDFMTLASVEGSLLNAGVVGLLLWAYVLAVGGPLNGPVLGGIFTAIGFATFGKHPRNVWPVMAGAVAATLLFGKGLASPGPLLAALFVLTLAPLAGEFGWPVGIAAGFVHLAMVEQTGVWHLGINLYNNGFAGGLTATLFVAVIEWYRSTRESPPWQSKQPRGAGRPGTSDRAAGASRSEPAHPPHDGTRSPSR